MKLSDLDPKAREIEVNRIITEDEIELFRNEITLLDMDIWLAKQSKQEKCYCPTCQTKMNRYKYTFDKSFLTTLIAILKLSRDNLQSIGVDGAYYEQIHHKVRDMLGVNNKNTRFRVMSYSNWGLIERVEVPDYVFVNVDGRTEKRKTGFWRVTHKGKLFLMDKRKIPEKIFVFNDNVYDVSKEQISLYQIKDISDVEWELMKKPF